MTEKTAFFLFISSLDELVSSGIPLEKSLAVLSEADAVPQLIASASLEILDSLEAGHTFSFALSSCSTLHFDEICISFIACAEQTGNIAETLAFLKKMAASSVEAFSELKLLVSYPAFVLASMIVLTAALFLCGSEIFPQIFLSDDVRKKLIEGCISGGFFAAILCAAWVFVAVKTFGYDADTYVFQALYFLNKSGVPLSSSLNCVLQVAYGRHKLENFISETLEKIRCGSQTFPQVHKVLDSYCCMVLSAGEKTSSFESAFSSIASHCEQKTFRRRQLFIRFSEPVLLFAAAGYLMILLLHCTFFVIPGV